MSTITEWLQNLPPPTPLPRSNGVTAQPAQNRHACADSAPRPAPPMPERRLLVEVLRLAVHDLFELRDKPIERIEHRESARRWIEGEETCPIPFAYACEMLELHPEKVRTALLDRTDPNRAALLFEIGVAESA